MGAYALLLTLASGGSGYVTTRRTCDLLKIDSQTASFAAWALCLLAGGLVAGIIGVYDDSMTFLALAALAMIGVAYCLLKVRLLHRTVRDQAELTEGGQDG